MHWILISDMKIKSCFLLVKKVGMVVALCGGYFGSWEPCDQTGFPLFSFSLVGASFVSSCVFGIQYEIAN